MLKYIQSQSKARKHLMWLCGLVRVCLALGDGLPACGQRAGKFAFSLASNSLFSPRALPLEILRGVCNRGTSEENVSISPDT